MSDSNTWHDTILPPTPTGTGTGVGPVPKRRHVRGATGRKPGPPRTLLTVEEKQKATTLSAAGQSQDRIAKAIGRSRNSVKRYLGTDEAIVKVEDERAQLVEIYKDKARLCALGVTEEKVSKGTALQLATASAIFTDKALLLSGMPTSIVHVTALVGVLDILKERRDEEEERQHELDRAAHQEAKAARTLLTPPTNPA